MTPLSIDNLLSISNHAQRRVSPAGGVNLKTG